MVTSRTDARVCLATLALAALALGAIGCSGESASLTAPDQVTLDQPLVDAKIQNETAANLSAVGTFRSEVLVRKPCAVFTVKNTSDPGIRISELILDLSGSQGGAYFDITPLGAGVGWFYPLYTDDGWDVGMTSWHGVNDGSKSIRLTFDLFDPGKTFEFRIDVDRLPNGIAPFGRPDGELVSGSEFAGARMMVVYSKVTEDHRLTTVASQSLEYQPTGNWRAAF
ncbi:MAG: hypothetical protein ONB48_21595 [candidate division KSB1 bacterium]|nr:hypothetical protein [candidate division KSB1 bacterium]MDZ7276584.1 hypothetical protein [candidate division KSB1 bacterium]MDZ7288243.1 hypothetical protein [candidate division KSB1 bacterium]MDZ7300366.1 hypothetical protein [candidate division KSB1 bacterium]MDZ7309243.1 hypothetical protein [candidate division KSB1 bacterium]